MRAISLWQPWASAVALGVKRVETRHWSTNYTGPLAIHAAKRWTRAEKDFAAVEHTLGRLPKRIPLGALVATCTLMGCRRTEDVVHQLGTIERLYGDYTPGRFAWFLTDIKPLDEPIGWRGHQGFFSVPDDCFEHAKSFKAMSTPSLVWIEESERKTWRWNVVICGRTYARCDSSATARRIQAALRAVEVTTTTETIEVMPPAEAAEVRRSALETASKLNDFPTPTADMNAKGFVDPRPDFKTDGECKEHLWRLDSVTLQHRCVKCNAQKIKGDDHG